MDLPALQPIGHAVKKETSTVFATVLEVKTWHNDALKMKCVLYLKTPVSGAQRFCFN